MDMNDQPMIIYSESENSPIKGNPWNGFPLVREVENEIEKVVQKNDYSFVSLGDLDYILISSTRLVVTCTRP